MILTSIQQAGTVQRSIRDLATHAEISPRQAQRIVTSLEISGFVQVRRVPGAANYYRAKVAV